MHSGQGGQKQLRSVPERQRSHNLPAASGYHSRRSLTDLPRSHKVPVLHGNILYICFRLRYRPALSVSFPDLHGISRSNCPLPFHRNAPVRSLSTHRPGNLMRETSLSSVHILRFLQVPSPDPVYCCRRILSSFLLLSAVPEM